MRSTQAWRLAEACTKENDIWICPEEHCLKKLKGDIHRMAEHLCIHTNEKPYTCSWPACTYTSNRSSNVTKHIHTQHCLQKERKKYQFSGEMQTTTAWELIEQYEQEDDKWICPHCHKTVKSDRYKFAEHLCTHTGDKPYKCPWDSCTYASTRRYNVNQHIRSQHQQASFQCSWPDCRTTCSTRGLLVRHFKQHQEEQASNALDQSYSQISSLPVLFPSLNLDVSGIDYEESTSSRYQLIEESSYLEFLHKQAQDGIDNTEDGSIDTMPL